MYDRAFVTTREAAELLGCSTAYVRRLLAQGRLKGHKAGRDWLVSRADLERFRAEREA